MGSCSQSATCKQCDSSSKQNPAASFRPSRESNRASVGGLSQVQRQRLESEADQMAERFMQSRSTPAVAKPFAGLPARLSSARQGQVQKKALPLSASPQTVLLQSADEEKAAATSVPTELKGSGSVDETAESNVGEPSGAGDAPREGEEVLTKRADNQVAPVAREPSGSGGSGALPAATQREMGSFFGRDFSSVRIHNDAHAHQYTQRIGALAATRSNHIYLSNRIDSNRYTPLLAHELTHVVQQGRAPRLGHGSPRSTQTAAPNISRAPIGWQLYQETICAGKENEHASTQPQDFPDTYISQINVSLTNQRVTLDWTGPSVTEAEEMVQRVTGDGVINCSTGAGVTGQASCNNEAHSISGGSCCTPIGTFTLGAQSCVTPRLGLQNFSGFQRSGVGFHYYPSVPSHPASHGCVRLHRGASRIIFDSARSGHTSVVVSGSFASSYSRYSSCS
jgi:hypothetical protein